VLDGAFVGEVVLPLTGGAVARASLGRRRSAVAVAPGPGSTWLCSTHEDLADPSTVVVEVFASAGLACARADKVPRTAVSAGTITTETYRSATRWRDHAVAEALSGEPGPPFVDDGL
jgi:hypothetical protein